MAEALSMDLLHHEAFSPLKAKYSFHSSGLGGGSGNIRRPFWSSTLDLLSPREGQITSGANVQPARELPANHRDISKKHLTSSGRGGSGNIRPLMSGLEAHPLTALIIQEHDALEVQYEQWVRKVHGEFNVVRSSGRGGSGNISNPRRQCSAQDLRTTGPKRRFFTTKGRGEENSGCASQAHDRRSLKSDKSRATCSSGSSSLFGTLFSLSRGNHMSDVVTLASSSESALVDLSAGDEAITSSSPKRRSLMDRRSRHSSATSTLSPLTSPSSLCSMPTSSQTHMDVSGSQPRVSTSSASDTLEHDEYESFLDF